LSVDAVQLNDALVTAVAVLVNDPGVVGMTVSAAKTGVAALSKPVAAATASDKKLNHRISTPASSKNDFHLSARSEMVIPDES
jgi:hypothetical protein